MPEPDDAPTHGARSRRAVLGLAGALVGTGLLTTLGGCRVRLEQEPVRTPPPPTPDELARDRAAAEADDLLDLAEEVRRLRPDAAAVLGRIATEHEAHVEALRLPPATTTPSPRPASTATTGATTSAAPSMTRSTALTVLARRESAAAERLLAALEPVSGDLARLLAAIAASRSCHADALTSYQASSS